MLTSIALTSTGLFILSVKALFSMNARRHRCRLADIAGHTYADQTEKAEQQPGDAAELQRRYQEAVMYLDGLLEELCQCPVARIDAALYKRNLCAAETFMRNGLVDEKVVEMFLQKMTRIIQERGVAYRGE
jgi:hypothetical protein